MCAALFFFMISCSISFLMGAENNYAGERANSVHPSGEIEFVFIKGGCFDMGDIWGDGENDEQPLHKVCVDDFYIGTYEITVGQWKKVMVSLPNSTGDDETLPVVNITWQDAKKFTEVLGLITGEHYRLSTEAEWEYAAREGGKELKYATESGKTSRDLCNVDGTASKDRWEKTSPAGSFPPNQIGIYDMCGNAWEWVEDDYGYHAYKKHGLKNPLYRAPDSEKVIRGCGWSDNAEDCRVSLRDKVPQDCEHCNRRNDIGFRIVKVP